MLVKIASKFGFFIPHSPLGPAQRHLESVQLSAAQALPLVFLCDTALLGAPVSPLPSITPQRHF